MTNRRPQIRVLQASIDPAAKSEFRILVDDKAVKYIIVEAGVYGLDEMCFEPTFITLLPPLPPGDWKKGFVVRNSDTGKPFFSRVSTKDLPGITTAWHPTRIDYLALQEKDSLRSNVYTVTSPDILSSRIVVAKFARFDWEVPQIEAETEVYHWIQGRDIGPTFLGHVTEHGRVIGFLVEHIIGARHAEPEDYGLCREVLSRLHELEIGHGDINKHNFLIHDGRATLIDFEWGGRCSNPSALASEMRELQSALEDTSGRGGRVDETAGCTN